MIKKSATPAPSVPQEKLVVPELKGEILIRAMLLKDRLGIALTDGYGRMAAMLAACVFAEDDQGAITSLFTEAQWEDFGALHYHKAIELWEIANRLSDISGEAAEKKSRSQKSASPAVLP